MTNTNDIADDVSVPVKPTTETATSNIIYMPDTVRQHPTPEPKDETDAPADREQIDDPQIENAVKCKDGDDDLDVLPSDELDEAAAQHKEDWRLPTVGWPEPVIGEEVFTETVAIFNRFMILPEG